ncbi:MAG TPA: hypothetical protein VFZ95_07295 [Steroidobacteraceae bacterium]
MKFRYVEWLMFGSYLVNAFAASYPMDARPVQPLNGRDISASR